MAITFNPHEYSLLVVLFLVIVRIAFLKNLKLIIFTTLLGLLMGGYAHHQMISKPSMPSNVTQLTLAPDNLKVSGDLLSGMATSGKQKYKIYYRIPTEHDKESWKNLDKIVDTKIKAKNIESIKVQRNPGEFNYSEYLNHKKIYYSITIDKFEKITPKLDLSIKDRINVLRIHLIKRFDQLPKWLKIHAHSLLLGYNDNEDEGFLSSLSTLGIIHLFSLSGLHVIILLSFVRKICSSIRITREFVDTTMLIILPMYGIFVGSKPGIWRAIVLAMVGIVCLKLDVVLSKTDIFAVTMVICLLIDPYALMDMGGQLSFLLSFALLFLSSGNVFVQTMKINLVSLPIILFKTYQFSWLILLANLIFVPIFEYVILPVTIISAIFVNSGMPIWRIFNFVFEKMYGLMSILSNNNDYLFITGTLPVVFVLILTVIGLFISEEKKHLKKYLIWYLIILVSVICLNKFPIRGQVAMIDVGQGDSILITTPINRKVYLIDTGGKLGFPQKEWQKRKQLNQVETSTIPYLKSLGINHIDKVFLSHKDVDHIGNLETLVDKFPVREVDFGSGLEQNFKISSLIKNNPQIKFNRLQTGDSFRVGNINWNILWPKEKSIGENGDSLTILAKIQNSNWLFTGDLDKNSEKKILDSQRFHVDYLKVGHHGSKTSSSEKFIQSISPKLALISAGINNRYGHPNKETIDTLDKYRVDHMNTADYGMIIWYYYPFGNKNEITTFLKGEVVEDNRVKTEAK
ncbi:DNA internalization-related competence protein ComEC/Rec2 [Companilactobacillus hulinensis]|uniref:DNA internalization-related competence protein ComEC/Rec2 n=1 Tax=Companilactobacillus hulinensis TaxID=2486007 RepID=UPI0013DE727D|nr:DNA internalization-related competence protein ComEC/Rec2 [Companilactobacillus hulinensis]